MARMSEDEVIDILDRLQEHYARPMSLVINPGNWSKLPELRALELDGLIEIKVVLQEKRWVSTPAGVLWRALVQRRVGERPSIGLVDLLTAPSFCWMRRDEAFAAARALLDRNFAYVTSRENGGTLSPLAAIDLLGSGSDFWIFASANTPGALRDTFVKAT